MRRRQVRVSESFNVGGALGRSDLADVFILLIPSCAALKTEARYSLPAWRFEFQSKATPSKRLRTLTKILRLYDPYCIATPMSVMYGQFGT